MNQVTHQDFGLFETESLSVDFISSNIKRITSHQITRLASYFQNLGFNSYQKQLDSNQSRQNINNNSYNQFEVYFILKIPYQKEMNRLNKDDLNKIKKEFRDESNKTNYKKILNNLELLLEGQEVTQKDLQLGFIGLAKLYDSKLMKESEDPSYIATRTRIAICLLTVTGIRISELLPLKVGQLETLLKEGWISIDRLKKGPANHKAFLTREGKKLVKARKRDFEFLFLMKNKDSYVFTSDRNLNQMLRRETITMDVNRVMHAVSKSLPSKPKITSHSFRIGYISQLWKDTKDIEFVRQTIGHNSLNSTSSYVNQITDEQRENRIFRYRIRKVLWCILVI